MAMDEQTPLDHAWGTSNITFDTEKKLMGVVKLTDVAGVNIEIQGHRERMQ
jgi:hypothetical protein